MRHIALCLALAAASPLASAGCLPIVGTVKLTPEPLGTCTVATSFAFPGIGTSPTEGQFLVQSKDQSLCYKSVLKLGGLIPAYGYSGVTSEPMETAAGPGRSPAIVQVALKDQVERSVLTARSTFVVGGTRFYAAEVIIESDGLVTEQSVITGTDGKGLFKKATGGFTILGNSLGETAQVRGQICTP